jgi:DNA-binding response OmpR family regulator
MMNEHAADAEAAQTILVVDDDPKIVRLVRSYLEQSGYRVESVNDGNRALQAIQSLRPDLVVLDLMLPGQDGLSVTRAVRSDPKLASTAILMLTARVEDIDRIIGLELGADDYVTKPFNPREVVARVKAILRRGQTAPSAASQPNLHVANLTLDPTAHTLYKAGEMVSLTPSEFDLIHLFMRYPGRAITRTQIIEEGLGYEYDGLERTVDSHIKNLRRKLEDDPRNPVLLETVFGVGYRIRG